MDPVNFDKQTLRKFIHKLNGDLFIIRGNAELAQTLNSNQKVDQHINSHFLIQKTSYSEQIKILILNI